MIILGLGSNIGNRLDFLKHACHMLNSNILSDTILSPIYESDALVDDHAPAEWNLPFLNMTLTAQTTYAPEDLLIAIKEIEKKLGRKTRGHWGPREIDIDIIAYHDTCYQSDTLTIPHPQLCHRAFVIYPLKDVAPNWRHPKTNETIDVIEKCLTNHYNTQRYHQSITL